jgi:F-type H+-transporting ATPase subunit epsilon
MRFRLTDPVAVLADREITSLQAEDATGRFGIRPGHERFLTALEPCILVWRFPLEDGPGTEERFAAVRGGVLRVGGGEAYAAVRSAEISENLADLREVVRRARARAEEETRRSYRSLYQMQIAAWRRLMEYEDVG